ncbi:LytT family sensor histidine kinase [Sporocytophaga myxococcoides]|uniref:LytT family sensor histidine kinase n=1 Tax=Sporocytophaga myxococcoides TaxID=153721 RepID=A0A098L9S4_9BACT|nr:histidine kinase [Sporocytophaga myxococcoides]GAL82898.1 LytT family sensor histidine kinase [Sporocytophaga myxococcoides]
MIHPFTGKIKQLYFYITVWVLISIAHTVIVFILYQQALLQAFLDAAVFNFLFSFTGLSLWYMVRYLNFANQTFYFICTNYLGAAVVYVLLSVGSGYLILNAINTGNSEYLEFLDDSLPWRCISGIFYFLAFILSYYLIMFSRTIKEKQLKEAELKSAIQETELSMLKSQLNPHFIFNSLNSINALTILDPKAAGEMIVNLSTFLRKSLDQGKISLINIEEELETINLYLDIEKIRFGEKLRIGLDINDSVIGSLIPPMLLQPLVENAVKHGVYESLESIVVSINAQLINDFLHISIENSFDPEIKKESRKGIGLRNVAQRLFLTFGRSDLLKVKIEHHKFRVDVLIPQKQI